MPKIFTSGLLERVFLFENPIPDQDASPPLMQFTDRIFLANYSVDAIAAALPAGITSFTAIAFFMGVAYYTNVFVAQYT